ncbi:ABC transporter ATP-binding protein/permease [Roseburia rectibacter]|jgi:ATP-binding cassette subfamily B multidrug efflux pump|uniref:ABC transporter ATP-binding protein n=1 Tax=Roseburia rectibacter TaxID=2763062 RepID=UPI00164AFE8D|nr:ABC transporter ATP-binding protein [Roseburia rectibacter]UMZ01455.1 ABC transporter ATP-binding protein/permease [Roseburia rectibacter]
MAEKNTKPVHGPGGRGPKGPRPKVENPGRLFMRLLAYIMKNYTVHCILVVICIFITVLASVQGTWFMQTLIDSYILPLIGQADPDFSGLLHAIMRVAFFYLIGALASYIYTRIMVNVSQGTLKNLRDDMFTHMEELPIRYFDTHYHGDIMSTYTNDIDTLRQMISQSMPQFLNSIITIVSVFVSMLLLNVPLTIVTLLMIGVTLFATKKIGALSAKYFIAQQKDIATVNGYIEEMMNGQKVVKVFTHEEESIENFNRLNDQLFHSADNANKFGNILMPVNAQIGNISYVLCALVGGVLALNGIGGFTLGKLASFLTYNKSFSQPVNQLSMQLNNIVMALAGSERIFKLLDEEPETDEGYVTLVRARKENGQIVESKERTGMWAWKHTHQADGSVDYIELKGDVVFDDVDFGYNPDKIVLHNVDLYATPGQKIAFVGSTGAGKTTITNLINRFYDIQDGKIRYDGININKIKKDDLRHSLGIVLQDTHLFTATVMENIRYGKLDATDEEVIAAAKLANADTFIHQLPDGYNTLLTGDGANLSQGQRQLLAIARAAIADPPVLILDEATSSIDTRTEKIVQDGMDKLMAGRTTFVIAHRLSTVKNSDCIIVLEQGRVIERGNHDKLMEEKGKYYQLYTGNLAEG